MNNLYILFDNEIEALNGLLTVLQKQYDALVKKDVYEMEACVSEVKDSCRNVAAAEMERRKITGNEELKKFIMKSNDEKLDDKYREIMRIVNLVKAQKETNDMLTKQGLIFTGKILTILNPDRSAKTYGKGGKIIK